MWLNLLLEGRLEITHPAFRYRHPLAKCEPNSRFAGKGLGSLLVTSSAERLPST